MFSVIYRYTHMWLCGVVIRIPYAWQWFLLRCWLGVSRDRDQQTGQSGGPGFEGKDSIPTFSLLPLRGPHAELWARRPREVRPGISTLQGQQFLPQAHLKGWPCPLAVQSECQPLPCRTSRCPWVLPLTFPLPPACLLCPHPVSPRELTLTLTLCIRIELSFLVRNTMGAFSEHPEPKAGTVLLFRVVSDSYGLCPWQPRAGVVEQIGQGLLPSV